MPLILTPGYLEAQAAFYEQLGTLQRAGLGLIGALQTVGKNPPRRSVVAMVPRSSRGCNEAKLFLMHSAAFLSDFPSWIGRCWKRVKKLADSIRYFLP